MSKYINPYKLFFGSMVPNWLMERPEVSSDAKLAYARLCQYAGAKGEANPKQATLAEAMGASERRAHAYIRELVGHGLIESVRVGMGHANVYRFLPHPWAGFATSDATETPQVAQAYQIVGKDSVEKNMPPTASAAGPDGGKKASHSRPLANPNHTPLREYFAGKWQARHRIKLPWGGREGAAVNAILAYCENDLAAAKRIVDRYLADDDRYVLAERHPIHFLASHIARWAADAPKPKTWEDEAYELITGRRAK